MHKLIVAKHVLSIALTIHGRVPAKVYVLAGATALDAYTTNVWIARGPRAYEADPLASVPCGRRNAACLDLGAATSSAAAAAMLIIKPHSRLINAAVDSLSAAHAAAGIGNLRPGK